MGTLVPCSFTNLQAGDTATDPCVTRWTDVAFYAWIFGLSDMQEGMPMVDLTEEHIKTLTVSIQLLSLSSSSKYHQ